jgi:protease I
MARIAFVIADDFEDNETIRRAPRHTIEILGAEAGKTVTGKQQKAHVTIGAAAAARDPNAFDALVIPGSYSPDHLRTNADVVRFCRRWSSAAS